MASSSEAQLAGSARDEDASVARASDSSPAPPKVLLVVMPWADLRSGGLGASTLKAILLRAGIATDVWYPNVALAKRLGVQTYGLISQLGGGGGLRGDVFFSPHYFDLSLDEFVEEELATYCRGIHQQLRDMSPAHVPESEQALHRTLEGVVREVVPSFLQECLAEIRWDDYDIVGFSLMFDQTLASLCLAREVKRRHPHLTIVLGGASCDGEMGVELARSFPCVDVVVRGEADSIIVGLVRALRSGAPLAECPGVVFRRGDELIAVAPGGPVGPLDMLPIPDYDDYVAAIEGIEGFEPSLYFESSRGCWWGQKNLCSFCGLNATNLSFRGKSPRRVRDELLTLERRHGISSFTAADNIIELGYFDTLLPMLAELNEARPPGHRLRIFYETKSNLRKPELELLRAAGVTSLQPGIESFSDHVLALMRKGCTAIQQIQLIRWAAELQLQLVYGILVQNPGETVEDYEGMASMVRFIRHLPPPLYVTPVSLDRFSPYFREPERYGIRRVRAHESYLRLFPDPHIDHDRLAYKFAYDHDAHDDPLLQQAMERYVSELLDWRRRFRPDTLVYWRDERTITIRDTRAGQGAMATLRGGQAEIFSYCDRYRSFDMICRELPRFPPEKIRSFLDDMIARAWIYEDGRGRLISLPVHRLPASTATRREETAAAAR